MARILCVRWKLAEEEALKLLSSGDQAEDVGPMLSIHRNLRGLFPQNPELTYRWMGQANTGFEGRRPLDLALGNGIPGLKAVLAYLEQAGQV